MTFKYDAKFIDNKIFQQTLKQLKIDFLNNVSFDAFLKVLKINDIDILKKLEHFVTFLVSWNSNSRKFNLDELLNKIYKDTELECM